MWWHEETPQRLQAQREAARESEARKREAQRLAPGPNLIAHCTGWWPFTTLPWQCPVCQAVLLEEQP